MVLVSPTFETWCLCLHTYLLTPSSRTLLQKLTGSQLVKEIFRILWNPQVHNRVYKSPPPLPILSHIGPVNNLTSHFLKIHLNIILPSTSGCSKWSHSLRFPHHNPIYASPLPRTLYVPRLSHLDFITRTILAEQYRVLRISLWCLYESYLVSQIHKNTNIAFVFLFGADVLRDIACVFVFEIKLLHSELIT